MITILFEVHGSTFDNEDHLASGTFDVDLSSEGEKQASEMRIRYEGKEPDLVFCSDLKRAVRTAQIAFGGKGVKIVKDPRLRECNIGEMTRKPLTEIQPILTNYINLPFPEGESFADTTERMKEFLNSLFAMYDGKTIVVIGHRATQYGLEHWLKGVPLEQAITAPWKWQPGWSYEMQAKI